MAITFRRLADDDLPMLHQCLNEPGIVRWWEGDDVSWDGVVADYGSTSDPRFEHWLPHLDGGPIGWIQCYSAAHSPEESEHWFARGVSETAAGIDYFVADPGQRGHGVGSAMIAAFVDEIVFDRHPGWTQAAASPYDANIASWRALGKAGFRSLGLIEIDGDPDGPLRLMVIDRPPQPTAI